MSDFIQIPANRIKLQQALAAQGLYKGALDGILGPQSAKAVSDYRKSIGLTEAAVIDAKVLSSLNLTQEPTSMADTSIISTGIATAGDYLVNFLSSKINWAAGALVVLAVGWVNTRFGFVVPEDIQNLVTGWLVAGGGGLIVILRTFFNKPKVVSGQAVTVTK